MNLHLGCSRTLGSLFRSPHLSGAGEADQRYQVDHPPNLVGYHRESRRSSRRWSVEDVVGCQEARRMSLPVSSS
jgi:hypothetical protein